jgi:hypothetical protein
LIIGLTCPQRSWGLIIGLNEEIPMAIGTRKLKIMLTPSRDFQLGVSGIIGLIRLIRLI